MNFSVNFPLLSLCSEFWWWRVGPQWRPRVFSHPEVRSVHRRRRVSLHRPQHHRRDGAARVSGSALWVYSICSLISFYQSHILLDTTLTCLRGICLIHSSTAARLQSREHIATLQRMLVNVSKLQPPLDSTTPFPHHRTPVIWKSLPMDFNHTVS